MILKEAKGHIRAFMRNHYTDERLAMLLAHARDGKLAYVTCCCFVGIPTADHALRTDGEMDEQTNHPDDPRGNKAARASEEVGRDQPDD